MTIKCFDPYSSFGNESDQFNYNNKSFLYNRVRRVDQHSRTHNFDEFKICIKSNNNLILFLFKLYRVSLFRSCIGVSLFRSCIGVSLFGKLYLFWQTTALQELILLHPHLKFLFQLIFRIMLLTSLCS